MIKFVYQSRDLKLYSSREFFVLKKFLEQDLEEYVNFCYLWLLFELNQLNYDKSFLSSLYLSQIWQSHHRIYIT